MLGTNETPTHWAHTTHSKLHKINFRWTIHNFSFLQKETGDCLQSPTFSSNSYDEIKWNCRFFPKSTIKSCEDYVSIFFTLLSQPSDKSKILGKGKFSILNAELKSTVSRTFDVHEFKVEEDWGYKQIMKRALLLDKAQGLLPDDTLTIDCELSFVCDNNNIFSQKIIGNIKIPECGITKDFGNLLDDPQFSDVILVAGEHNFPAHKAILAARSDVFAAMFKHEMKENLLNRVTITDVDHDVLQEVLRFIYTGDAPKLKVMANHLLVAADKYALGKLKAMAEEALFAEISIETAAEILVLADLHNADQLKEEAKSFITLYAKDIIKTKGWQNMVNTNAHSPLIAEILEEFL